MNTDLFRFNGNFLMYIYFSWKYYWFSPLENADSNPSSTSIPNILGKLARFFLNLQFLL